KEKLFGEVVEVGDFGVAFLGPLVDGQKALIGVKSEVVAVVVGKVPRVATVADDKDLNEAQQRIGVTIAGFVLVGDDLLHGAARVDAEALELNLHHGQAVNQEDNVIAVVAVAGVYTQLA